MSRAGPVWCIGDSITEGKVDPNVSYRLPFADRAHPTLGPSYDRRAVMTGSLTDKYGYRHDGVSGRTANQVLLNLPTMYAALPVPAEHALLLIGTNNVSAGTDLATFESQVQQIVDYLVARSITVWMSYILPRADGFAATVASYNARLANVTGCAAKIDPGAASWWSNSLCIGSDNLHTTPHCEVWLAREWLGAMRGAGVDI